MIATIYEKIKFFFMTTKEERKFLGIKKALTPIRPFDRNKGLWQYLYNKLDYQETNELVMLSCSFTYLVEKELGLKTKKAISIVKEWMGEAQILHVQSWNWNKDVVDFVEDYITNRLVKED